MIHRVGLLCFTCFLASGCSYLFPEDSREGEEAIEACAARLGQSRILLDFRNIEDQSATLVPTYTYDITKMDFSEVQELIQPGADETLGRRLISQTNEFSTARAQFMEAEVDEKGAFFFGERPSLWRVRGEAKPYGEIIEAGCARQQSGMRLIAVDVATSIAEDDTELTENEQTGETEQ